ncbi:MAG: hypothetical protein EBE86_026490 [Hormoscilla sp. GUM202]|nr:hypothetical protein [Hormoscilla sp. GUM202]
MYKKQSSSWQKYWKEFIRHLQDRDSILLDTPSDDRIVDLTQGIRLGDKSNHYTGTGNDDTLYGEGGHDEIHALDGNDILNGGYGKDTLVGGGGSDTIHGGLGLGKDSLVGGEGNDYLVAGNGADTLVGGDGEDTFVLSDLGSDVIQDFVLGEDKIQLPSQIDAANLELELHQKHDDTVIEIGGFSATLLDIDKTELEEYLREESLNRRLVLGESGDDEIAEPGNDIEGGDGNDSILGGQGNDILLGSGGNDTLIGGEGDDIFGIALGEGDYTTITDFHADIRVPDLWSHWQWASGDKIFIGSESISVVDVAKRGWGRWTTYWQAFLFSNTQDRIVGKVEGSITPLHVDYPRFSDDFARVVEGSFIRELPVEEL